VASNFFQRWSSRSLTAKDKAAVASSATNEADVELAVPEQAVEPIYEVNAELNQSVIQDDTANNIVDDAVDSAEDNAVDNVADKHNGIADDTLTIADVDSVTFDSGVASFLQQGVDKSVRKAALAKLFHADEFNYISDMDDHTEDFSNIPKLDDSIAKQLRGWAKTVLEEPEQETELLLATGQEQESGQPEDYNVEQIETEMSAVEDGTVEPIMEDLELSPGCDKPHNKTIQQGET